MLIAEELKGVRDLYEKELAPLTRVISLDRDRTRIAGDRGRLISDIATARGSIAEKKIQMARLDDEFHAEVVSELAEVRNKINENVERKVAAQDRLSRIDIRAPVSGQIHQLAVFTVGGVISAGEVAMLVVPDDDKLVVDAQIEPQEIEELQIGQKAVVRFTAFSDPNLKDADGGDHHDLAGPGRGSEDGARFLPDQALGRRAGRLERPDTEAGSRHAGRNLYRKRRPHGACLSDEAGQ